MRKGVLLMNKWEYQKIVNEKSPKTKFYITIPKAFVFGGAICTIGEAFRQWFLSMNITELQAGSATSIVMIFLGALLTGLGIYDNLAKHGGAGTSVPITGFANAIVSPAIEYKSEGMILGVAAKMFVIAGPVLVYGTISSVIVGLIHYIMQMM